MTAAQDTITKKLLENCKYSNPIPTRNDIMEVLAKWQGLKPVALDFVFGNGQTKKLVALQGTIPILYKGQYYHIPVEIFLLDTHPDNAPLVYVRPTPSMRIKPSRNVDSNGKVYLPFLHAWKPIAGEVMALIQVLIMTFGDQPPVFAVPTPPPTAQPMPPRPLTTIPTNVPYPMQQTGSFPMPYPSQTPYPASMPIPAMPMPPTFPSQPTSTVTPAHIRASLTSAVSEKLTRRLEDIYFTTEIELKTGDQLKEGTNKLLEIVKHLDDEKSSLEKTITECESELEALDAKIASNISSSEQEIIDDAVQAPTPLYKQIVNVFAEEAALRDTIYYLSEGLRNGKLDLDQFQKHLRILTRKQFMLRAVLRKCREKAGLAG